MELRTRTVGRYSLLATTAAAALALSACGSDDGAPAEGAAEDPPATSTADQVAGCSGDGGATTVQLGTFDWIGYGPWTVAIEQGIDSEFGLDIEQTTFTETADLNAAIAGEQVVGGDMGTSSWLTLVAQGINIDVVLWQDASTTADAVLVRDADVTSLADLAGRTVAYEEGSIDDFLLQFGLGESGLTLDDVNGRPLASADAGVALIAGRVDAAVTYEPYVSQALSQDDSVRIIYSGADAPGLISDVLALDSNFVDDNPTTVECLIRVWDASLEYLDANSEQGRSIIAADLSTPLADLQTAFDGIDYKTSADTVSGFEGGDWETSLTALRDLMIGAGNLDATARDFAPFVHVDAARRAAG